MKALVYTAPETLEFKDTEDAQENPDELLVKIESSGICGSDMHAFLGHDERRPAPLILGHEACGSIVNGARQGERVTINPLVACGSCEACVEGRNNLCGARQIISMPPRQGAFAEYVSAPPSNLVTVPDHISSDQAALAEPLACGWHAIRLAEAATARPLSACNCLVIGGGAIGFGAALVLNAKGAKSITISEPNPLKRPTLETHCDCNIVHPDSVDESAYDIVVDAVGFAATRATACASAKPGGIIMHIGLGSGEGGVDSRRLTLQEITFIGTYTYTPQDFQDTAAAIFDGSLGTLDWVELRALRDGAQAFDDIRSDKSSAPKIVLKP